MKTTRKINVAARMEQLRLVLGEVPAGASVSTRYPKCLELPSHMVASACWWAQSKHALLWAQRTGRGIGNIPSRAGRQLWDEEKASTSASTSTSGTPDPANTATASEACSIRNSGLEAQAHLDLDLLPVVAVVVGGTVGWWVSKTFRPVGGKPQNRASRIIGAFIGGAVAVSVTWMFSQ